MDEKIYIDGTIFLAESLEFLPMNRILEIPMSVNITRLGEDLFKGVTSFKNKDIHHVHLQRYDFGNLGLIFAVEKYVKIEWSVIRKIFIETVEFSLNSLRGTKSYQHWKTTSCNSTYTETVASRNRIGSLFSQPLIYGEDIKKFSRAFVEKLHELISIRFSDILIEAQFCLLILGQNAAYDAEAKSIELYNMKHVKTLVVHFARDFCQTNQCLFWDLSKTNEHLLQYKADYYYPGLTVGAGNVYYSLKPDADITVDNNQQISTKLIKYYSSLCKEVHRTKPAPFKSGIFHKQLIDRDQQQRSDKDMRSLGKTMDAIKAVKTNVDNTVLSRRITARLEVIYVIEKPDKDSVRNTFTKFQNEFGSEVQNRLIVLDFDQVHQHFQDTIYPVLNTFQKIVEDYIAGRTLNYHFMLSIGKIQKFKYLPHDV